MPPGVDVGGGVSTPTSSEAPRVYPLVSDPEVLYEGHSSNPGEGYLCQGGREVRS